jgi:cytochrome d ubiquinol oxidase subunit II
MPIPAYLVGAVMFIALVIYMLTGGADFGGGVWDLFAFGPRKEAQREVIAKAIAPIWEANHVWLIIVIVLMFVCFPQAFAVMTTALHIPISMMLVGIVLRGSAFVFRTYDKGSEKAQRRWGLLFAIGSIITPIMLGVILGGMCSGNIASGFIKPWLQLFPFSVGLFALVLCAFLAATYMIFETHNLALRSDFRKRAWLSGLLVLPAALLCLFAAKTGAPQIYDRLTASQAEIRFMLFTMGVGFFATGALYFAWDQSARVLAMLLVVCILVGWVFAQFPYIIIPDHTIASTAAPSSVTVPVLWALGIGAFALVPSFFYLYRIFKAKPEGEQGAS